jgi:hypothetical protein
MTKNLYGKLCRMWKEAFRDFQIHCPVFPAVTMEGIQDFRSVNHSPTTFN